MKLSNGVAVLALVAAAGAANAGVLSSTLTNKNIFGGIYNIDVYRVATDLSSQGLSPAAGRLEPEGMVFFNNTLYVTGDGSTAEANGYLAAYAGGNIASSPTGQRFTVTIGSNTAAYGPEGVTVNTRGSGYGSFGVGSAPRLVGVDSVVSPVSQRVLGQMNTGGPSVDSPINNALFNFDDIAYIPGADAASDRFAVIDASGGSVQLSYYTTAASPAPTGIGSFALPTQAKGLLYLPASEAALFSPLATGDSLLVAISPEFAGDENILSLYSLSGSLIASSGLGAAGTGVGRLGNIESLAYDSVTKRLFIGDENGASSQIAVLTIPGPGAAMMVVAGGLVGLRRRRSV